MASLRAVTQEPVGELSIEELASETGMTVRNIRNHQSRGLLPPPVVRNRIGYYGPEHAARLRLIQEMQADGFNLNAIKRLLSGGPGIAEQLIGFKRIAAIPFETESPQIFTAEELLERFGPVTPKSLAKAQKLELLVPLGDGRYEAPTPSLLRMAEDVTGSGVSLHAALVVVEQVKRNCETVARAFVNLFLDEVWKPFVEAGRPDERWPEILETVDRLRPLAEESLVTMFRPTMTGAVEHAVGKELSREAGRGRH